MKNIYDDLEIKDYGNIDDLIKDIILRFDLVEKYDLIKIFGDSEFIINLMIKLVNLDKGFKPYYIDWDNEFYGNNFDYYFIDITYDKSLYIEHVYGENDTDGKYILKIMKFDDDEEYIRCFLNQDCVNQEIVDYSLTNFQETMLFGIDE